MTRTPVAPVGTLTGVCTVWTVLVDEPVLFGAAFVSITVQLMAREVSVPPAVGSNPFGSLNSTLCSADWNSATVCVVVPVVVRVYTPVNSLNWARIVSLSAVKVSVSLTIVCPPTTLVEAAPNVAPANEESESRSSPGMNEPIETVALLIAFTSESAKPVSSGTGASFSVNVT